MQRLEELRFDNIYATLPQIFYSRHRPDALSNQFLIHFNKTVAQLLGIDPGEAGRQDLVDLITLNKPIPGFEPIAMCYAGHQFGQYVPRLGDGRAILLGQLLGDDAQRWDLQLKGAGRTLYSRQGDGKAVLRSTIREHLCSVAMHGLGIPTTHSLAMFGSDEEVYRERIETGAMLIRVAPSHIRFGSFEYFFYTQRYDDLKTLVDFTLQHYFADLPQTPQGYLALLDRAITSTAELIARWQSVGFCHGVMNSDNMSIHGITIDYGPFGFLDVYDPAHICNHSDHHGRYAFNQQPRIGLFNLSCLAQAMLPLFDDVPEAAAEKATEALGRYETKFDAALLAMQRRKLGLRILRSEDRALYEELLTLMAQSRADFTNVFRRLSEDGIAGCRDEFLQRDRFDAWAKKYTERLTFESDTEGERRALMCQTNPLYVLRNYMAENAIRLAEDNQDYAEIDRQVTLLESPFESQPGLEHYAQRPPDWAQSISVSCSS